MEAVILAGGLGTRLKLVISDMPKPMAPIGNKPFLEYILHYLEKQGISRVILSVGYKHEAIEKYFGNKFYSVSVSYSIEDEPLGTGGGLKKAFEKVTEDNIFILNGDTFFNVDLHQLARIHISMDSDLTLALKPMKNFDRYGVVITDRHRVTGFAEKQYHEFGNINGGVYMAKAILFEGYPLSERFSFETDFMEKYIDRLNVNACISDNYFVDIGIPKDYNNAQNDLMRFI